MHEASNEIITRLGYGVFCDGQLLHRVSLDQPTGHDELALLRVSNSTPLHVTQLLLESLRLREAETPRRSPVDVSQLSVGDKERLLLALCRSLYGSSLDLLVTCPDCGETIETDFPLDSLDVADAGTLNGTGQFDLALDWRVHLRPPQLLDVAAVSRLPPDQAARGLISACIVNLTEPGGGSVAPDDFPPDMEDALANHLGSLDPQSETLFHLTCPACGAQSSAVLDALSLVLKKLSTEAGLFSDIFQMAQAYHWSEAEILAMPVQRRKTYLAVAELARGLR